MRPAAKLAMDYAFSVLNLYKLYLIVDKENAKAIHIYEKLGFKKEGDLIDEFFVNGSYRSAIRMCTFQAPYFEQKAKATRPENFVKPGATIKQYV